VNVGSFCLGGVLLGGALLAAGQTRQSDSGAINAPIQTTQYRPLTGRQRFNWFALSTVGPQSLAGGVFSAGFGTALNKPEEYHGTWEGFGKRYGLRLSGVSTGNAIETGLGALWQEDPRYFRAEGKPFGDRVRNTIKMTFLARGRDGRLQLAFARYAAISGNNFLSNAWRPDSEADASHAARRTLWGFLGRMGSNAFQEFWPEVSKRLFRRKSLPKP
jgi:hypothetical protein